MFYFAAHALLFPLLNSTLDTIAKLFASWKVGSYLINFT